MYPIPDFILLDLIKNAYLEDTGNRWDKTSEALFDKDHKSEAILIAKQDAILCGIDIFIKSFQFIDGDIKISTQYNDGDAIAKNSIVSNISGNTYNILIAERVALNFIAKLSGVATKTNKLVKLMDNKVNLLCTRKTTPLFRNLDKYAAKIGGAYMHRMGLDDLILIKDNHIKAFNDFEKLLTQIKKIKTPYLKIEIEIDNFNHLELLIENNMENYIDIIMLDNFDYADLKKAIQMIDKKFLIEISGNINETNINDISKLEIDFISSGSITHSANWIDFSLKVK